MFVLLCYEISEILDINVRIMQFHPVKFSGFCQEGVPSGKH